MFEVLLFGLTVGKAIQHKRRNVSMPVTQLLYRDGGFGSLGFPSDEIDRPSDDLLGFIYFIFIAACSVFNILVWTVLPTTLVALAK